jgi:hypothetical protein
LSYLLLQSTVIKYYLAADVRYSQEIAQNGWQSLRNHLAALHARFYVGLFAAILLVDIFYDRYAIDPGVNVWWEEYLTLTLTYPVVLFYVLLCFVLLCQTGHHHIRAVFILGPTDSLLSLHRRTQGLGHAVCGGHIAVQTVFPAVYVRVPQQSLQPHHGEKHHICYCVLGAGVMDGVPDSCCVAAGGLHISHIL